MSELRTINGELYAGVHKVLRGWESYSGMYWFGTEEVEPGYWFGYVQGAEEEWGYFTEAEMAPLIKAGQMWPIKKCDLPYAGRRNG
jgi:hypothetical protein